jgi:hypothetical protein
MVVLSVHREFIDFVFGLTVARTVRPRVPMAGGCRKGKATRRFELREG